MYQKKPIENLKGPHLIQIKLHAFTISLFPKGHKPLLGKLPPTKPSHKEHDTNLDYLYLSGI